MQADVAAARDDLDSPHSETDTLQLQKSRRSSMHDPFSSSIAKDSHTTKFKPSRRINENRPIEIMKRRIPPEMEKEAIKPSSILVMSREVDKEVKQGRRLDYANIQRNIDDSLLE